MLDADGQYHLRRRPCRRDGRRSGRAHRPGRRVVIQPRPSSGRRAVRLPRPRTCSTAPAVRGRASRRRGGGSRPHFGSNRAAVEAVAAGIDSQAVSTRASTQRSQSAICNSALSHDSGYRLERREPNRRRRPGARGRAAAPGALNSSDRLHRRPATMKMTRRDGPLQACQAPAISNARRLIWAGHLDHARLADGISAGIANTVADETEPGGHALRRAPRRRGCPRGGVLRWVLPPRSGETEDAWLADSRRDGRLDS